ncbi:translation initiation factor IF-2-like [Pectinophora gossypiella]|uniref:translation initiation factor IF-2-like n=1 Tax=Pectinophora gossypiella TaxID=13191 RepID=UPI00214EAD41|nr:translation initiation factor IF-2-like [Pectinophora gossypiella]
MTPATKCYWICAWGQKSPETIRDRPVLALFHPRMKLSSLRTVCSMESVASPPRGHTVASGTSLETESESPRRDLGSDDVPETVAELCQKAKDAGRDRRKRGLQDSSKLIVSVLDVLRDTTSSDETRNLQAQNARLQRTLEEQQKEIDVLRQEMRQMKASLFRIPRHGTASACATLGERASRAAGRELALGAGSESGTHQAGENIGPAAARGQSSRVRSGSGGQTPAPESDAPTAGSGPKERVHIRCCSEGVRCRSEDFRRNRDEQVAAASGLNPAPRKRKRGGRKRKRGGNGGQSEAQPLPSGPAGDGWTVVGRGRKKKAAPAQPPQRPKAPKLRPPRTSAVVVQLQPAAVESGASYADILREAKSKVDLQSLGISGLKVRKAATGARVLEVAGASSAEKADSLAAKLRESMSGDVVKVSRPTKCAQMRVVGLDDSVTAQEVVEAVAKVGGCAADGIKAGAIREGAGGMGSLLLSCPFAAAKKGAQGRLLVGWTSAQVKVLEPRPLRCFRCLDTGHTHALCKSEVDRSTQCFRCGQTGHQSAQCSAAPHCTVCEAARRPAEHRLGGSLCTAQSKSKRKSRNGPQAPSRPSRPQAAGPVGEPMSTN